MPALSANRCLARAAFLLLLLSTVGCSSIPVEDYRAGEPPFIPETFFNGSLTAHGVVLNRSGRVIRHFNARIEAYWEDGVGTLDEDFVFDDGETQKRVWTLTPDDRGGYVATAGDVVGDGSLAYAGNALFLDYVLRVPWRNSTIDLRVDDRMYRVDEHVVINESRLSKFGIGVGRILLTITRLPE